MNAIEEQRALIDELYRIVRDSRPNEAVSARCRFEYSKSEDGSSSVSQRFSFERDGQSHSSVLKPELRLRVMGLVKKLHASMKAHTGGDWEAFTLTIGEDGRVTTKFEYPEQT